MKYGKGAAAALLAVCLATGCGTSNGTTNNLGGATERDVYGSNIYWDGYGINAGRGTNDTTQSKMGQDMENMTQDMKDMVKNNPVTDTVRDAVNGNTARNMN